MQTINPNLRFLCSNIKFKRRNELLKSYEKREISFEQYKEICQRENIPTGALLEGSSRSGKTISSIDFPTWLASVQKEKGTLNIIRETYNSHKITLYDDFSKRLDAFGVYNPFADKQEVGHFKIYDLKVNLLGADSSKKLLGAGSDYVYFNEILDIPEDVFDQVTMRCRKFWWGDFNPKYSDHYIFKKVVSRPDVCHLKTTYRDNPFISPNERIKIESYQPVQASQIAIFFGSNKEDLEERNKAIGKAMVYDCAKNVSKFPPEDIAELTRCQENERIGTANPYNWDVYGRGERRAPEGLIFPKVTWIRSFPQNCEKIYWGLDFGYTESPSVLVKVGVIGTDLFAEIKFYQPTASSNVLLPLLASHITKNDMVWADPSGDSGGRGMISACQHAGYKVFSASTYPGSIKFGISILKKYNIHLIDCPEWRSEQAGYTKAKAKVNGSLVTLDNPIDDKNHAWDATRITALSNRL